MNLVCPICGEPAKHAKPIDTNLEMPRDRQNYSHKDRTALCPVLGITASGVTGYIPTLPITARD